MNTPEKSAGNSLGSKPVANPKGTSVERYQYFKEQQGHLFQGIVEELRDQLQLAAHTYETLVEMGHGDIFAKEPLLKQVAERLGISTEPPTEEDALEGPSITKMVRGYASDNQTPIEDCILDVLGRSNCPMKPREIVHGIMPMRKDFNSGSVSVMLVKLKKANKIQRVDGGYIVTPASAPAEEDVAF